MTCLRYRRTSCPSSRDEWGVWAGFLVCGGSSPSPTPRHFLRDQLAAALSGAAAPDRGDGYFSISGTWKRNRVGVSEWRRPSLTGPSNEAEEF